MSLGEKLRQLREDKGWTQLYAAKIFGITNGALSNYERDERMPDANMLKKFAEVYGTSIDSLMDLKPERTDTPTPADKIADSLSDDPELLEFWDELREREDLQLLFKQTKEMSPEDVKKIIRIIKAIEDEEAADDSL